MSNFIYLNLWVFLEDFEVWIMALKSIWHKNKYINFTLPNFQIKCTYLMESIYIKGETRLTQQNFILDK